MPKQPPTTIADLRIPRAARFLALPKKLTKAGVKAVFDEVLLQSNAKSVAREIRVEHGSGGDHYTHSFLCFRTTPQVPFLNSAGMKEVRFGFVLLLERRGHLVVFHRAAKGLDDSVATRAKPVSRRRLTHLWSESARYQKLSTRRMTIAKEELRGASYEADDLETAFIPALAARSILQTIRLATDRHGSVGVTPSTGRVRLSSSKADLAELVTFVDETILGISSKADSSFLGAFPEPVELDELPTKVEPAGMLFDVSALNELIHDESNPTTIRADEGADPPENVLRALSAVLTLRPKGDDWEGIDAQNNVISSLRRLKDSFSANPTIAKAYSVVDGSGVDEPLDRWLRRQTAYSVSFSSPEYFYSDNKLFRRGGFTQEATQIATFIEPNALLVPASSEKGDGKSYSRTTTAFASDSIFRIVETGLASADKHLWCCDLGDEWADYIGVGDRSVTFYHCKHGTPTTGASDFQIVVGQALKNLARVKFRREEMREKIARARDREHWGQTKIPLLAKSDGGWARLELDLAQVIADPNTKWSVALVVTALSVDEFATEASRSSPKPHFVQLIWLLSAFVSACRERDAQPRIYCRP